MNPGKGKETEFKCLGIQKYLKCDELSNSQKSLLHQLRFRLIHVRANYRHMYDNDIKCLWCLEDETTEHLLSCAKLIDKCNALYKDNVVQFQDIFSDELVKQVRVTKLYEQVLQAREELMKERELLTT